MFKAPFFIEGIKNIFKKPITEEGSIEKVKAADNYRGRLSFNEDACIGCGLCLRVCAGNAITKSIKPVEGGQEITMTCDMASCTFCGLCQDFCSKKAITLTDDPIIVEKNKGNLKVQGTFIKKMPAKVKIEQKAKVPNEEMDKEKHELV